MGDRAGINRSLNTVRTELEYLRDAGVLSPPQYQSIMAQLPQEGGAKSQYVDPRFVYGGPQGYPQPQGPPQGYPQQNYQQQGYQQQPQYQQQQQQNPMMAISQAAQDPNHPAHPEHKQHFQWAEGLAGKFANAAVFGGGSTLGADVVNSVWHDL